MVTKQNLRKDISRKLEDEIRLEVISKKNQREGLCKDCVRAEKCILSHNTKDTIWDCEDYSDDTIRFEEDNRSHKTLNTAQKPEQNKVIATGLCPYCINNDTCSLKAVEGGVWHCTEYA